MRPGYKKTAQAEFGAWAAMIHTAQKRQALALCKDAATDPLFAEVVEKHGTETAMKYCVLHKHKYIDARSLTREKDLTVFANGKALSVDDIVWSYEILFERRHMFSQISFPVPGHYIGMQQDPNDAFALADLLWRVRPRLLIELGTSGGGSALFYARTMRAYDPRARVLTMDPADFASTKVLPLVNWNQYEMSKFCPFCSMPNTTSLWREAVTYVRGVPSSQDSRRAADALIKELCEPERLPVMVIEDSDHSYTHVAENLAAYYELVTPGSYLIVQDTRAGRFEGPSRAVKELLARGRNEDGSERTSTSGASSSSAAARYVRDRRPEYLLFSQHSGGFLRRLKEDEQPGAYDELL